ncbi:hypothetical protein [Mastigocoleus sp. MO_188.B34]|uniref:hypothetical protein n=1 Tax=Mastigocoleus sp. MO_188.B34 TaxID=3036635 RepID=UPI0026059301|nr:hypothetical protein [Mastigocoleus sp. MO_188.B34]MDJ0697404.1 hypothetical protein [Mastigocoleus sp. MO_188.B34]
MNRLTLGMFAQALVISFSLVTSVSFTSAVASKSSKESNEIQQDDSKVQTEITLSKSETELQENQKIRKIRSALAKISNRSKKQQSETILRTTNVPQKSISAITIANSQLKKEAAKSVELNPVFSIDINNQTQTASEQTLNRQNSANLAQNVADPNIDPDNSVEESLEEIENIERQLRDLEKVKIRSYYSSPSLSIYVPVGYGSDNNTGFVAASYQDRTRLGNKNDAAIGFGAGFGDSRKSVGVVLSYTLASFGTNRDFGTGGFNVKVHRQFKGGWAAAVGMNGFLNIGDDNDFEHSLYGVATKIFRIRDDINKPFSRIAVTAGIGNGEFRTEEALDNDEDNFNVFGNVAVRVHPQASLITEWTGRDLGVGASIAPFKHFPFVITPAIRDITGSDRNARFILSAGFGFKF